MKFLALGLILMVTTMVHAQTPVCTKRGQAIPVDNAQVLDWKLNTNNQYHDRGHVFGTITKIYADHSGHHHFQLRVGSQATDNIEVIYNEDFGAIPASVHAGSQMEACGDYITANQASGPYPASPDGALIHWVHRSPNPHHDSGYLVIDGTLCGWN